MRSMTPHLAWTTLATQRQIVVGCWIVFWTAWLVMAFSAKDNAHVQPARERQRYTLPLLLGILLMSGLIGRIGPLAPLARRLGGNDVMLAWAAAGAAIIGLLVALWARWTLGRNWSGVVTFKADHELVTHGPYAAIRHPIYTALILLFLATALLLHTASAYLGLLCIVWSCWVKLKQEEALMLQQFPDSYPGYMSRTARLLPGIV